MKKNVNKLAIMLIILITVTLSVFLFFKSFKLLPLTGYASEILAAFLGAVFTTVITAILLYSQSVAEEQKEKSLGIFQAKIKLYSEFIDYINLVIEDGTVDKKEQLELMKWASKIALLSGERFYLSFQTFIYQVVNYGVFKYDDLTDNNKTHFKKHLFEEKIYDSIKDIDEEEMKEEDYVSIGDLIAGMRSDMGEEDISNPQKAYFASTLFDELLDYKKE